MYSTIFAEPKLVGFNESKTDIYKR